jgi:hypothetical protein
MIVIKCNLPITVTMDMTQINRCTATWTRVLSNQPRSVQPALFFRG